jgi:hypothetical protein
VFRLPSAKLTRVDTLNHTEVGHLPVTRDIYLCTDALIIQIKELIHVFGCIIWISPTACLIFSGGQVFRQAGCACVDLGLPCGRVYDKN